MRYAADHKQATRRRIVEAAAAVFKRRGQAAAGVDEVMREAGLTAGGFYAHFPSKDALFAEAIGESLQATSVVSGRTAEAGLGAEHLRAMAAKYLSGAHCRTIEKGCPMPPLLADLARASPNARVAFAKLVRERLDELMPHFRDAGVTWPDAPWAMLALFVGGVALARAMPDEAATERIVVACRRMFDDVLRSSSVSSRRSRAKPPALTPQKKSRKPKSRRSDTLSARRSTP